MRLFLSALFLTGSLGLATADDVKKTSVAEQAKAIETELMKKSSELQKKFTETKDAEEKAKIRKEAGENTAKAAEQALALAKANKTDPGAIDAAVMAVRMGGRSDVAKQAETLLYDEFSDMPAVVNAVPLLSQMPGGKDRLAKMAETTGNRAVKGGVRMALAASELEEADYPRGKPVPADETAKLVTAAKDKLAALVKEFGEETVPGPKGPRKLSATAEKALFFADNLTVGRTAPEIGGELLDGKKAKLSDYRGKVVVVDVWATWCPPCRAMIPHERELTEKLKDKPFVLLSVSADEKKETLTKFLDEEKMPWTHWWVGTKGGLVEKYQIRFYPTIYVLDAKGVIRFKHVRGKAMDEAVEELLKETEKTKTGA